MLNNGIPISFTQVLGNICFAKICQLQAILNMTIKFDMSLDLLRKMFPVVHTRLSPSFFSLSISKKQTRKAINFSRMMRPVSQLRFEYQVLVNRCETTLTSSIIEVSEPRHHAAILVSSYALARYHNSW